MNKIYDTYTTYKRKLKKKYKNFIGTNNDKEQRDTL